MKRTQLARIAAIIGVVLLWLPLVAPFFFAIFALIAGEGFLFDYLMPAEFFFLAVAGAGLLILAAVLARQRWHLIGWGIGLAILFLVLLQWLAVITGLAHGTTTPGGWEFTVVLICLGFMWLSLIACGVGGIRLVRAIARAGRQ